MHKQLCMNSEGLHSVTVSVWRWVITCREFNMLKLKGNSDRLGKQEDEAAWRGVHVQIELHGV